MYLLFLREWKILSSSSLPLVSSSQPLDRTVQLGLLSVTLCFTLSFSFKECFIRRPIYLHFLEFLHFLFDILSLSSICFYSCQHHLQVFSITFFSLVFMTHSPLSSLLLFLSSPLSLLLSHALSFLVSTPSFLSAQEGFK